MPLNKFPPVLVGNKYGRLVVIKEAPKKIDQRCWLVRCICGNEKEVRQAQLKDGTTQSCGCLQRERAGRQPLHGHTIPVDGKRLSSEYSTWNQMKQRCTNPNGPNWKNYGGRGITVCDRWLNSFEDFLADVGPKPVLVKADRARTMSLGRIDNDKGYEPGNVEWQTYLQQAANKRRPQRAPLVFVGGVYGHLTVLRLVADKAWCVCVCGKEKSFVQQYLKYGRGLSCGCFRRGRGKRMVRAPQEVVPTRKRNIQEREPWQIALYEAARARKDNRKYGGP